MSQAYRAQSIPSLPPKLDPQLRQFLASVKEILEVRTAQRGNPQDTAVTFRDLIDQGVLSVKDGININGRNYTRDELAGLVEFNLPSWITSDTAPPAPVNLVVRSRKTVVDLSWDASAFDSYSHTEIWRAEVNDLSKAVQIGSTSGTTYVDSLPGAGGSYYYWIRDVSRAGLQSPYNDVNGAPTEAGPSAPVVTAGIVGPDYVLSWVATASNLLVAHYLIEFETATGWQAVASVSSTVYRAKVQWLGERKFRVRGVDVQGNTGLPTLITVSVTAPGTLTVDRSFVSGNVRLAWTEPSGGSLPVAGYRIYVQGNTLELQAEQLATTYQVAVTWANRTFQVSAVDTAGNEGPKTAVQADVLPPTAPVVTVGFASGNAVLRWAVPTGGTLPVARYRVYEGLVSPSALLADQLATIYTTAVTWSSRSYFVVAVDTAGNQSAPTPVEVAILPPQNVTLQAALDGESVRLSWGANAGSLPVAYYNLRYGTSYASGVPVMGIQGTAHAVRADWTGSRTFWIAAVDTSGTVSAPASVEVAVGAPAAPALRHEFSGVQSVLSWQPVSSSLPLAGYEVRYGASFAEGNFLERVQATGLATPVTWLGQRKFWVAAYDSLGNYSAATSFTVDVSAPSAPTISTSFAGPDVVLRWTASDSSLPLAEYEIRYGATFATASTIGRVKGTTYTRRVDWVGQRQFWVVGIDQLGNMGTPGSTTLEIKTAPAPNLTTEVIDNNVLLRWSAVQGTLPTDTYEIRKGASWEAGTGLGTKAGEFTTIFETVGGSYTYWLAAVDTAGNYGTAARAAATVAQPPDYVLAANWRSTFSGTKVNAAIDVDGSLFLPVSTDQTWESHFTSRGWAGPQAQVNAGYPIYAQPGIGTGYYEEVRDYGTTLAAMKVTVEYVLTTLAGSLIDSVTITTALDAGFTQGVQTFNAKQAYAVNFRYVRVRVTVTGADDKAVGNIAGLTIKLDAKLKTFSGIAVMKPGGAHAQGNVAHDYLSLWTPQTQIYSPPAGFSLNGGPGENRLRLAPGPSGQNEVVWVCVDSDTESEADGGWVGSPVPADCARGHLFAVFIRTTTNNGDSYWGPSVWGDTSILNISDGSTNSNPYFWYGDLPSLNTWFLVVGYVHPTGYGTTQTSYSGVFDLAGNKIYGGTDYKFASGATYLMHRCLHFYNPGGSGAEVQHMARPVVVPCDAANVSNTIRYILNCGAGLGSMVEFGTDFVDVDAITATPLLSAAPTTAIYDFVDAPNPKRFNVFNYSSSGAQVGGTVSYTVRGY